MPLQSRSGVFQFYRDSPCKTETDFLGGQGYANENNNCAFPLITLLFAFIMLLRIMLLNNIFSFDEDFYSVIVRMLPKALSL